MVRNKIKSQKNFRSFPCLTLVFAAITLMLAACLGICAGCSTEKSNINVNEQNANSTATDEFPDGIKIDSWFSNTQAPTLAELGTQYSIKTYGATESAVVNTTAIQSAIDAAANAGGGLVVVPAGTYVTGAIFFKPGVNLYVQAGGVLKGSDDMSNYPIMETRIEGETCSYYPGLVNADGCNGFVMAGEGTIDGNGERSWAAFWQRRKWNPDCTNKDEQRARLVYISNSSNVTISGLRIQNAQFWTTHIYKCDHVRYLNCDIYSPTELKPPSTDAIDIDVCTDVLVHGCTMNVNDDAIALKGGKGPWADTDENNGSVERVIVQNCHYSVVSSCLTCGSEAVHCKNIIMRNIQVDDSGSLLRLKYRPDTPQNYEYIFVSGITGHTKRFIYVAPWTQFYNLKGRTDMPVSHGSNVTMANCNMTCGTYYDVELADDQYILSGFNFYDNNVTYDKFGNESFSN